MNDDAVDRLFAKAREAAQPDTSRVEFGFETRLAARLRAPQSPAMAFGVWPWRLLPFFAVLAIFTAWNTWSTSSDNELAIRSGLESSASDWAYVEVTTGKAL